MRQKSKTAVFIYKTMSLSDLNPLLRLSPVCQCLSMSSNRGNPSWRALEVTMVTIDCRLYKDA